MPGLVPGIHVNGTAQHERRGWPGHRRAEATPSLGRLCPAMTAWLHFTGSGLAPEPADMLLGVKFEPDPPDQIELGFEEVDVVLLVLHQALEQIARDVILD